MVMYYANTRKRRRNVLPTNNIKNTRKQYKLNYNGKRSKILGGLHTEESEHEESEHEESDDDEQDYEEINKRLKVIDSERIRIKIAKNNIYSLEKIITKLQKFNKNETFNCFLSYKLNTENPEIENIQLNVDNKQKKVNGITYTNNKTYFVKDIEKLIEDNKSFLRNNTLPTYTIIFLEIIKTPQIWK